MPNYYGVNCTNYCNSNKCQKNNCNAKGDCDKCIEGYIGKKCDKCSMNYILYNNKCEKIKNLSTMCKQQHIGFSIIDKKYGICENCLTDDYGMHVMVMGFVMVWEQFTETVNVIVIIIQVINVNIKVQLLK